MRKLIFIIAAIFPISASSEMVVMYLNTENTYSGIKPCEMIERGSAVKSSFYKFNAMPGSGGCHAKISKEIYYKNFMFCGIGNEQTSDIENKRGDCSIYPSSDNELIVFSAMPGSGPRDKIYYQCTYVCETKNGYQPNFHNVVSSE